MTDAALLTFFKHMGFEPKASFKAVTEYALYCKVPINILTNTNKVLVWEEEVLPKIEELISGPNGPTIIAAYKARRYSFPRVVTVQPRRFVLYLFVVAVWTGVSFGDLRENIVSWLWRRGWL